MTVDSVYDFTVESLEEKTVPLNIFKGKVLLIVNVATFWGSTIEEYHKMNALMKMYGHQNFIILGFPCNQFGLQSPEENPETLNVLRCVRPGRGYTPQFPIFSKIEVNGENENRLYAFLKESLPFVNPVVGDIKKLYWSPIKVNDIRWNFEKFLISADGVPYRRYDLHCPFEEVEKDIEMLVKGGNTS